MGETTKTEPRAFREVLDEHRSGAAHDEMSEALQELASAVLATKKKGTITLKFTMQPKGDAMVELTDDIKLSAPEPERGVALYFIDGDNNLVRDNPKQGKLQLRPAEDNVRELKG